MTGPLQLDLFEDPGELPAPEPQAERWETSPQPCPICGYQETSGWMVRINHGVGPDGYAQWPDGEHPNYGTQCLAQNLVTGHLRRTAGTDDPHLSAYIERGRALGLDVDQILADAQRVFHDHSGLRIPAGNTVMRIENWRPSPHIVNVDMGDKPPSQCADDFDHHRRHELGQSHDRDGDVFTIRHDAYPGIYQRIWWDIAQ